MAVAIHEPLDKIVSLWAAWGGRGGFIRRAEGIQEAGPT
jgi:hypothetical protein